MEARVDARDRGGREGGPGSGLAPRLPVLDQVRQRSRGHDLPARNERVGGLSRP